MQKEKDGEKGDSGNKRRTREGEEGGSRERATPLGAATAHVQRGATCAADAHSPGGVASARSEGGDRCALPLQVFWYERPTDVRLFWSERPTDVGMSQRLCAEP
jgi:hypothetical protein